MSFRAQRRILYASAHVLRTFASVFKILRDAQDDECNAQDGKRYAQGNKCNAWADDAMPGDEKR